MAENPSKFEQIIVLDVVNNRKVSSFVPPCCYKPQRMKCPELLTSLPNFIKSSQCIIEFKRQNSGRVNIALTKIVNHFGRLFIDTTIKLDSISFFLTLLQIFHFASSWLELAVYMYIAMYTSYCKYQP